MPAIKGDMYINTHCNYSQPTLIKFDNENIEWLSKIFSDTLLVRLSGSVRSERLDVRISSFPFPLSGYLETVLASHLQPRNFYQRRQVKSQTAKCNTVIVCYRLLCCCLATTSVVRLHTLTSDVIRVFVTSAYNRHYIEKLRTVYLKLYKPKL